MKKLLWSVCFVVGLFTAAHAQFNEQQVDQALQRSLKKQDCQIHDIYTQSYLQKAAQEKKPLVITRSNKDWRKIYLLGDAYVFDTAGVLTGELPGFMNAYVNGRAEQRISVRKFTETRTPQDILTFMKALYHGTSFKLQTYDPINEEDGMISFLRSNKDGTVNYIVYRVFKGPAGKVFMGRVSRQLGSLNIPIMQGIFRALKQTPTQTLTEHFVENECQMGADCY